MRKILCILVGCIILNSFSTVQATNNQTSKPAMPYTEQASNRLTKVLMANQDSFPIIGQNMSSSVALDLCIKHYTKLWAMAGYDFRKSMNKYAHDMKVDPIGMSAMPIYGYTTPIKLAYIKLSDTCTVSQDIPVLKKYFSQEVINAFEEKISSIQIQSEKVKYWFPQGVVPCMLTDMQMKSYQVVTENTLKANFNMNSPFIQQKVKEAKMQERPLISKDLSDAKQDYQTLERINDSLNDGLSQATGGECYGSLNEKQEADLNRILNEYGTSVLDNDLKRKLEKYRQRQAYLGRKDINSKNNQSQTTTTSSINDSPDRADVMRFYNGNGYYPPTLDTAKKVVIPSAINKFMDYTFGLINY